MSRIKYPPSHTLGGSSPTVVLAPPHSGTAYEVVLLDTLYCDQFVFPNKHTQCRPNTSQLYRSPYNKMFSPMHPPYYTSSKSYTSRYIEDFDLIFVPRVTFRVSTAPGSLHRLLWSAQLAVGYTMTVPPTRYTLNSATKFAEGARGRIRICTIMYHASEVRPDRGDFCAVIDIP